MASDKLSILHPWESIRRLRRSPAYRLASGRPGIRGSLPRIILATSLALIVGGWTTFCACIQVEQHCLPSLLWTLLNALSQVWPFSPSVTVWLVQATGFRCALVLLVAGFVSGLRAFAPERRAGTMEQLVLLDLPRSEIILSRSLRAFLPLIPAVVIGPVAFAAILLMGYTSSTAEIVIFSGLWVLWQLSAVALTVTSGVYCLLQPRSWRRLAIIAALIMMLLGGLMMLGELALWRFHVGIAGMLFWAAFVAWNIFLTARVLNLVIKDFDALALGTEPNSAEPEAEPEE